MNILTIYNHYGTKNPSGETLAYEQEISYLQKNDLNIYSFEMETDHIKQKNIFIRLVFFLFIIFNPIAYFKIKEKIKKHSIDLVHVYNTWPFISVSAFLAAKDKKIIVTAPNYRFGCPSGIPSRNGVICTKCIDKKNTLFSIVHKCYRNSFVFSTFAALNTYFLRAFVIKRIDRIIVLTQFQADYFLKLGFNKKQIFVKPTPRKKSDMPYVDYKQRFIDLLFVGRISTEKGIKQFLNTYYKILVENNIKMTVVGTGPLYNELIEKYKKNENIIFLGRLSQKAVHDKIRHAKMLVVPSRWFEGLPLVLQEAFEFGTPLAVSDIGPLPSLVADANGIILKLNKLDHASEKIITLINNEDNWANVSNKTLNIHKIKYDASVNINELLNLYKDVLKPKFVEVS